ncbi:MAG: LysM peptidoglycan-binding domain-containing protein [Candidatus Accumulibacter sp.]|nr:LysM peptidoglycan-binding domain-containing protein [Accumulibacter sp.]
MIRIVFVFALAVFGTFSTGATVAADTAPRLADTAPQLADAAPDRYVVVRGDTLWDISARFLKEPWRWPEIWRMNQAQIRNPHRIYPGDEIVLDRDADGKAFLRLDPKGRARARSSKESLQTRESPKIYEELLSEVIPPIPPNVIEPFIATPLFIEQNTLQSAPRVVATQEDRVFLGKGDKAYVEGADPAQKEWQVFRNGAPLHDPEDSGRILGYEAFHLGAATQMKPGSPAVFEITEAKQEMGYGDRLVPATRPELTDYIPHAPLHDIDGRVVSIYGGVGSGGGGRLSIVTINRGSSNGLEIGHILAVERNRAITQRNEEGETENVIIPAERFGLIFVFRIFEHLSYALVVQSDRLLLINDFVRTP